MSQSKIEPIVLSILSGLESPGDTLSRQGHIDMPELELSGHVFETSDGLDYEVALTNTGEGILLTGLVRGEATTSCDRCLSPAAIDITGEISCYYLHVEPEVDDEDDEEYGLISPEGSIDISGPIQSAVIMDLPYVVLCSEGCKGLCPSCGCNLNEETCDCAARAAASVDPMSPFAALAGFDARQRED